MKRNAGHFISGIGGIALVAAGVCLLLTLKDPQGGMAALPYVCIGLGSGLAGQGIGNGIAGRWLKRSPEEVRRVRIEQNDERNVAVMYRAKAKALDVSLLLQAVLILALTLLNVGVAAILLSILVYGLVIGCQLFYWNRFNRTM